MVEISLAAGYLDVRTDLMTHRVHDAASRRRDYAANAFSLNDSEDFARDSRQLDNRSFGYKAVKRVFDLLVSTLVMVVGAVPGLLLAFFIWRSTGGSPIYSQIRVGQYGKRFRIYKFRTMVADSDNVEKYFTAEQLEVWNRERKVNDDPRITRLGRFLRATSVDELPNFINVFLGQMSTVGPRAIAEAEFQWYGRRAPELVAVTPGITGWWQVTDRNDAMYETGARQHRELFYVSSASVMMDIKILLMTFKAMSTRTGR